ncbi:MAG: aspartate-semialdehyde dehydrogenase [Candidatus Izemoplasmataceae bacterium]
MKPLNIAIVGATGMVGRKMLDILSEYQIPINKLYLFASGKSAGKTLKVNNQEYPIYELTESSFDESIDVALFSAGATVSLQYAPLAKEKGILVIDNSSAFRNDDDIPLIVPEININKVKDHLIIANPNCSTIQSVLPLKILDNLFGLSRVVYTTFQAVSGSGNKGIDAYNEKENQNFYPKTIFGNVVPHIDVFLDNGYTKEEMKMILETRKILGIKDLAVTATCVRVPVLNGHSVSINVTCKEPVDLEILKEAFNNALGITYLDTPNYTTPLDLNQTDSVYISRLRHDDSQKNSINFWVVADNIRKGAASNAVQILKALKEAKQ